jgi:predicted double-glycine peptidase
MCGFKSGLILKNRCVIAEGANDSHSDLLESLGIEDNIENAMRVFVRVELLPPNEEWWTDPDTWKENVDQDILPEWFENDKDRYFDEFRKAVKDWWKEHVRIDEEIEELSSGYYRLKRCKVKNMLKDVKAMLDNSTVQNMWDNSTVQDMRDNSTVQNMRDNSTVQNMRGNSTVQNMLDNSTVQNMRDNSTVQNMWGNSTVQDMWDNSTVQNMRGNSTVQNMLDNPTVQNMRDNSTVQNMWGNSTVQDMRDNSTVQNMWGNSTVQNMWGNSIARDSENKKIKISSECDYEIVKEENKKS